MMNTDEPILKELNQRRSVRGFLPKDVEPEKLECLWAAAQWAPSSSNKQEWHYYAVVGEARQKLSEVLNRGNQWALNAPLILGVTRDGSIENKSESREYGMYDVALSAMSLVVEAEHQGLRAHQMAGFKEEIFRKVLNIPDKEIPVVMVAVGYEGEAKDLPPEVVEKEKRLRVRKPINEVVTIVENL
jgi:nitroreductase